MRKFLLTSVLSLFAVSHSWHLHAQQYYNQTSRYLKANSVWTIYTNLKLNFNTHVVSSSSLNNTTGQKGCASVADPVTGALLFYSDGGKCWNANNAAMPNGSGLLGNSTGYYSTAQGVCIVPIPGETQKYYLFSLEANDIDPTATATSLYYSIVDMSLNNGLGDIVTGSKNILLDGATLYGEAMLAVQGNNCDVWLVLHTRVAPTFKAFHITHTGIDPNPVISTTGNQIHGTTEIDLGGITIQQDAYQTASIAISPNRNKLALACDNIATYGSFPILSTTGRCWGGLLCDFNANSGVVSNGILYDTLSQYNAAFSPDNNKLYFSSTISGQMAFQVSQVTVSSNDSATIATSKVVLQTPINASIPISLRAYNDSIYIVNPNMLALDRINKPNLTGSACNYQSNAISFPAATSIGIGLPNEVVYAASPDTLYSTVKDTTICGHWANGVTLIPAEPQLSSTYTWNNGSTGATLAITTAGTYWVKYGNSCHYRTDTFKLKGSDLNAVITANGFVLSTTTPYATYQWLFNNNIIPGATNSTYEATANGNYSVVVGDNTCTDTAAIHTVTGITGTQDLEQLASRINIYPNPAKDLVYINAPIHVNIQIAGIEGRVLATVTDAKQISVGHLAAGVYLLRITDKNGVILKIEKLIRNK